MADRNIPAGSARAAGLTLATPSAASMPFGQALAAHAFDALTPAGVVAIRQLVTALVLPVVRPPIRRPRWNQWWPVLTLGVLFVAMNLTLSVAIDRIGVALTLTLEFLGPLSVALAGSRSARDLGCAVARGSGSTSSSCPTATATCWGSPPPSRAPPAGRPTSCSTAP